MTYRFAGFLCPSRVERPASLPPGVVWREISEPFVGVGVRIEELVGKSPQVEEVDRFADALKIKTSPAWLYLTYDCWAGEVDFVYGLGFSNGKAFGSLKERLDDDVFGPLREESEASARDIFIQLMARIGLTPEQAMRFPPFERGFWGE